MARFLRPLTVIVALCAMVMAAAMAAERVAVRVGEHPGFSRLVFDWRGPVGVRLEQTAGRATVHFDRAAELDLARYKADPPPGIPDVAVTEEAPGMAVAITMADGFQARLLEVDGVVVVDVLQPGTPLDASPAKAGTKSPGRTSTPTKSAGKTAVKEPAPAKSKDAKAAGAKPRIVPQPPRKPAQTAAAAPLEPVTVETAPATASPDQIVAVPIQPLTGQPGSEPTDGPISLLPPSETPPTEPVATADAKAEARRETESRADTPLPRGRPLRRAPEPKPDRPKTSAQADTSAQAAVEDTPAAAKAEEPKPVVSKPTGVSSDGPSVVIDTATAPARSIDRGALVPLHFDWPKEVAAAAYRRGASLWLAFDHPLTRDVTVALTRLVPQFAPYEQFSIDGGTLIRMAAPPVLVPLLHKEGNAWIVDLWSADRADVPGIVTTVDGANQPASVSFAMPDAGSVLSFEDPELGDRLIVVPVTEAGHGLLQSQEFTQFRALSGLGHTVVLREHRGGVRGRNDTCPRYRWLGHFVWRDSGATAVRYLHPAHRSQVARSGDLAARRAGRISEQ
jgi:hypothetical protein